MTQGHKSTQTRTELVQKYRDHKTKCDEIASEQHNLDKLRMEMKEKVDDRWRNVAGEIYKKVGGVHEKEGGAKNKSYECRGVVAYPHKDCEERVKSWQREDAPNPDKTAPCQYINAVKSGVNWVVSEMRNKNTNCDKMRTDIITYLEKAGYKSLRLLGPYRFLVIVYRRAFEILLTAHSQRRHSYTAHATDLKRIVSEVDSIFGDIEAEIEKDRQKYAAEIEKSMDRLKKLKTQRISLLNQICTSENSLVDLAKQQSEAVIDEKSQDRAKLDHARMVEIAASLSEKLQHAKDTAQHERDDTLDRIRDKARQMGLGLGRPGSAIATLGQLGLLFCNKVSPGRGSALAGFP